MRRGKGLRGIGAPVRGGMVALFVAGVILGWGIHSALLLGSRRAFPTTPPLPGLDLPEGPSREVVAALHLHTRASWDGVGTLPDLVAAARMRGVEALFLSEHDNICAWEAVGPSGVEEEGVLLVPGVEVSLPQGHFLVWGPVGPQMASLYEAYNGKPTVEALDSLLTRGPGVGIVAHPRESKRSWRGSIPRGAAGLEIANGDSDWRNDDPRDLVRSLVFFPVEPRLSLAALADIPLAGLALWDSVLGARAAVGVAGLDAHGGVRLGKKSALGIPSYGQVLGLVRQHLLVRRASRAGEPLAGADVLEALSRGRSFVGYDCFGSTRGFSFRGESGGVEAAMGDSLPLTRGAILAARIPRGSPVVIRLLRDGQLIAEAETGDWDVPLRATGPHRLEVYQRRRSPFGGSVLLPWIISNPIYVTAPYGGAAALTPSPSPG